MMYDLAQIIHTRAGGEREYIPPGATAFYAGDGHDHWHISTFVVISLFPTSDLATADDTHGPTYYQRGLRKIGFCLTDLVRAPSSLRPANSAQRIRFPVSGCGLAGSTNVRMGISVGYGDDYKPFFNHQSVDITGLPVGAYRLCATVNSNGMWLEEDSIRPTTARGSISISMLPRAGSGYWARASPIAPCPRRWSTGWAAERS